MDLDVVRQLKRSAEDKVVLLVMDGLGRPLGITGVEGGSDLMPIAIGNANRLDKFGA